MNILPYGAKAQDSIIDAQSNYLTVWEGAVRSMKTVTSLTAWLIYVMQSDDNLFIMTGATQGSLHRNCIAGDFGLLELSGGAAQERTDKTNGKYIQIGRKQIYLFGGDNVSSHKPIHGITAGGWYADEVDKQHKNTIEECFGRSIVSSNRVNMWTMNPEPPNHWIYTEYIDKYLEDNLLGYSWHHFTLDDNPALSEERKAELKTQYSGIFYKRYILGLRVRAEGIIYGCLTDENVISTPEAKAETRNKIQYIEIGGDIGGNESATVYNAVGYWHDSKLGFCAAIIKEFYDNKNLSTESVIANLFNFIEALKTEYKVPVTTAYIDSAEALLIKSMKHRKEKAKLSINIKGSRKEPIIDRIRLVDALFSMGKLSIFDNCPEVLNAFQSAVWKPDSTKEERLDNGSSNIDSLDATEYTLERHIKEFIR